MKRILLSLAAVAALASCVKENTLVPVADQVTISAVSVDSKTLLDGNNVVWEKTDKIAVVVDGTAAEFAVVESTVNGAEADFTGKVTADLTDATAAYAVYPAAAVNNTHALPAEQTGEVSGLMLSTAVLSVEEMKTGTAGAQFENALALLNVTVPANVESVSLTSAGAALVGESTFEVDPETGKVELTVAEGGQTVTLAAAEAKTYPVIVYPGEVGELTVKVVGTNGEELSKTVSGITLAAAEARNVNLSQLFELYDAQTFKVSAAGGHVDLPFATTVEDWTVTTEADWVKTAVETKAFQSGNICVEVAVNEAEEARTAVVTVAWGDKSVEYTIEQSGFYYGFLNDAEGNPIQWEETFGVYASEADAVAGENAVATYTNVFTIAVSDNFEKGMYKVSNMFKVDSYWGAGYQMVSNKGGEYYADYADGVFTVKTENATKSYNFTEEVVLAYDETAQTFAATAVYPFSANTASSYNKGGYVGGYAAAVKVEEQPETPGTSFTLEGTWDQVVAGMSWPSPSATMTIAVNGSTVTISDFIVAGTVVEATLAGNTITVPAYTMIEQAGPLDTDVVLTVSDDYNTITAAPFTVAGWVNVSAYSAEKQEKNVPGEPETPETPEVTLTLEGAWDQVVAGMSWPSPSATMTIAVSGSTVTITDFVAAGTVVEATLTGNTITIPAYTMIEQAGPLDADVVLTVSDDYNTITAAPFTIAGWVNVSAYSAEKQEKNVAGGAGEPEPDQPADPWTSDAVVTYDLPSGASSSR